MKIFALDSSETLRVLPKQPIEAMGAHWLPTKKLLYVNRSPDRKKPGTLECYTL
jgi:hypothetical protein